MFDNLSSETNVVKEDRAFVYFLAKTGVIEMNYVSRKHRTEGQFLSFSKRRTTGIQHLFHLDHQGFLFFCVMTVSYFVHRQNWKM